MCCGDGPSLEEIVMAEEELEPVKVFTTTPGDVRRISTFGVLPRLFTFTSLGFGLVVGSLALATRWWALALLTAVGCGISVVNGLWAIWSRQTGVLTGGTGPGIGMVLAAVTMVVLTACWARIAGRRG